MWYAAAAGWLLLCGLALVLFNKVSLEYLFAGTIFVVIVTAVTGLALGLFVLILFLFVKVPELIFGETGAFVGLGTFFWIFLGLVLSEDDRLIVGFKYSTVIMIVVVPALILIGKV